MLLLSVNVYGQTDTVKRLNEVNINSTTAPQLQVATPAQVISASQFLQYNAFNVADAIRNFAGVNVRDYGGIGGLKTVSVRGLGANHTIVLYDNVQLNDAQNGQIDLSKLNLFNVSEVSLFIPQPADLCIPARSYSAGSVLSIKTIQPKLNTDKPFKIIVGVKGGSFGLINPYLQWQQRLSNQWSFIVNGYVQEANGRYKYKYEKDASDTLAIRRNGDVSTHQVDGGLFWTKSESNKLSIRFNYYNSERGLPGTIAYNQFSQQRLYNEDYFLQAGYQYAKNAFSLLINSKASQNYVHYTDPDYPQAGGLNNSYRQREFYQSAAAAWDLTGKWKVGYSADVAITSLNSDISNYAFPTRLTLLNALATTFNTGKWLFKGNLLDTYINDNTTTGQAVASAHKLTPTVIVTFSPFNNDNFVLRAFYKDIFRNPNFSEQYYYAVSLRNIKPEKVKQYNAGAIYNMAFNGSAIDYVKLSADAYYNRVDDKIIFLPNIDPSKTTVTNIGNVEIKGVDVSLKSLSTINNYFRISASANYTYQKALDVTNPSQSTYHDQIPYTPVHVASFNAGGEYKNWALYYNYMLSSSRYSNRNNEPLYYLSGYSISDLSGRYNFNLAKMPAFIAAECNNIFNKNYEVVSSYYMPGRFYRLTFQITI
ncbi:TonB-dependent receptor [Mucilaginibacter limnophilus]|nr:TonB-dependent receptor [Mucilaginibacter limnophilus]